MMNAIVTGRNLRLEGFLHPTSWLFLGLLICSASLADEPSTSAGFEGPRVLVLGKISDNPQRDYQGLQSLIDHVVAQLGDLGVDEGRVLVARDHRQMLSYMRQGKVDWVTETAALALLLRDRANATFMARRWKYGEPGYRSTIFVRADSAIQSISDLPGNTIAFEHPGSTTGYIVPSVELQRSGLDLVLMGTPRERPPAHMVGYLFSGDEINTSIWVHKRLVDAGAMADTDWNRADQVPPAFQKDLRIIFEGELLPRSLDLVREGLDPAISKRLLEVLINMDKTEQGREVLEQFQQTLRYDRYDPEQWPYVEGLWTDIEKLRTVVN
jgi:phosphonate transport system substrate-binding protein